MSPDGAFDNATPQLARGGRTVEDLEGDQPATDGDGRAGSSVRVREGAFESLNVRCLSCVQVVERAGP